MMAALVPSLPAAVLWLAAVLGIVALCVAAGARR